MSEYKRILVVSRMIQSCKKAIQTGVSLARKYDAELYVIHPIHNPFGLKGWGVGTLSLKDEYDKLLKDAKSQLANLIEDENSTGLTITAIVQEGEPTEEILKAVKENEIDLLIMLAHEEGRMEHLLFGHSNDELVRKMPCSLMLVKKEAVATR